MLFTFPSVIELLTVISVSTASCFIPYVRNITHLLTTLLHEVGHAVWGIPFFGFSGIHLHMDASAEAVTNLGAVPLGLRTIIRFSQLFSGYPAPIYIGGIVLTLTFTGNSEAAVWLLTGLGVVFLISARNLTALLVAVAFLLLCVLSLTGSITPFYLTTVIGTVSFVCGVKDVVILIPMIFGIEGVEDSDFHIASDELFFSAQFWYVSFVTLHTIILSFFAMVATSYIFS